MLINASKLGGTPGCFLVLSVLHQLLDGLCRQVALELERLNDGSCFRDDVALDKSLVRVRGVPLFADGHVHHSVKLLGILEGMRHLFDPVLFGELLIALFSLVDLHTLHPRVLSFFLKLLDLAAAHFLGALLSLLVSAVVNSGSGPFAPALLYINLLHL